MIISNIYFTGFIIFAAIFLLFYLFLKLLRNIPKIPKILFNFKVFFVLKKKQNYYYIYEKFKQSTKIRMWVIGLSQKIKN